MVPAIFSRGRGGALLHITRGYVTHFLYARALQACHFIAAWRRNKDEQGRDFSGSLVSSRDYVALRLSFHAMPRLSGIFAMFVMRSRFLVSRWPFLLHFSLVIGWLIPALL